MNRIICFLGLMLRVWLLLRPVSQMESGTSQVFENPDVFAPHRNPGGQERGKALNAIPKPPEFHEERTAMIGQVKDNSDDRLQVRSLRTSSSRHSTQQNTFDFCLLTFDL